MSVLFDDEHPYWCTQTRIVLFEKKRKPIVFVSPGIYTKEYDINVWPPQNIMYTLEDGENN
jgi:hypothetical protein